MFADMLVPWTDLHRMIQKYLRRFAQPSMVQSVTDRRVHVKRNGHSLWSSRRLTCASEASFAPLGSAILVIVARIWLVLLFQYSSDVWLLGIDTLVLCAAVVFQV